MTSFHIFCIKMCYNLLVRRNELNSNQCFFRFVRLDFQKKSKVGQLRNRSSDLGQGLLLKVSSNLGWRGYWVSSIHNLLIQSNWVSPIYNQFVQSPINML
jgi:hypothetical protein